ncbi:MAG TPA: flagellar hook-basal body complex protein FliE [Bacilli bacterium]|nr:flagellar hook-basal body complex protein FliE [Bacilli bacterium]
MINNVSRVLTNQGLEGIKQATQSAQPTTAGPSFTDFLKNAIEQVNDQQQTAEKLTEALATGQAPDLHTVMIASEKATLSFQLAVQVRNKAMEAYQEVMRMQM